MKRQFIMIGMDDRPKPHFPEEVREHIHHGKVFSGGMRHYGIVRSLLPAAHVWIPITSPLDEVFARYMEVADEELPIIVFASGDPLFFGFANTVRRRIPDTDIRLYPSFNSLQLLAHRILMRYDDMRIVSLTGRPWHELDRALVERASKIGVLTDHTHTPTAIARRLLEYGYTYYNMYIGTHLGHPAQERVYRKTLQEAVCEEYDTPNCLILQADSLPPRLFGIPDGQFELLDGRSRMITKMPIRLLTLQALDLPRRQVFWDIGFCTGSVSIEARLQFPHLEVCSFEIRPECEQLMHVNSRRFGTPGIQSFIGDFLTIPVEGLPAPDAVFIGGHGGRLKEIVRRIRTEVLRPGGCIVFNSVSAESRTLFEESVQEAGMMLYPSLHLTLNDYNPITILKAALPL